ncbi:MAG: PEP-CTERM sorting domain-containing protein [Phycisphaeraceae bacterium]|nr:PEP-CTERM sorting domain-containing protein [Phycisphaeraceae bacterium]
MRIQIFVPAALAAVVASGASAQLVFGTTSPTTTNPAAVYLDINSGTTTTLWNSAANKKVNGLAADTANGLLYANDAARLNVWSYGSVGTVPAFIGGMYRTNDNVSFTATGVDGLAFANNKLYASTSFGSTVYKRGIYQVNTTPDSGGRCVMTSVWLDPTGVGTNSGTIQFGGIDFNAADGKFWVTNGTDTTGSGGTYQRAIYTVDAFGTGDMIKIADFPTGHNQIDGLAIGGGYAWLTEQAPSSSVVNIFGFNLTTLQYDKSFTFALTDASQRASGACWAPNAYLAIPAPAAGAMLALGLFGATRRRRS